MQEKIIPLITETNHGDKIDRTVNDHLHCYIVNIGEFNANFVHEDKHRIGRIAEVCDAEIRV